MEEVDLRNLLMTVVEKKEVDANLSLEFDCTAYINDTNMLVKCINYGINYINQLSDQQMQISLNASMNSVMVGFTTFTDKTEIPPLNQQVAEALKGFEATVDIKHEVGKYAQVLMTFNNIKARPIA